MCPVRVTPSRHNGAVMDPDLATAMARADRVVHEELVLDLLLADMVTTPG